MASRMTVVEYVRKFEDGLEALFVDVGREYLEIDEEGRKAAVVADVPLEWGQAPGFIVELGVLQLVKLPPSLWVYII